MVIVAKPTNEKRYYVTKTRNLFGSKTKTGSSTKFKNIQSYKNFKPNYRLVGTQSEFVSRNVAGGGRTASCLRESTQGATSVRKLVVKRGDRPGWYCRGARRTDDESTRQKYIRWLRANKGVTANNPKKIPFAQWAEDN